jgi:hypothetical protein
MKLQQVDVECYSGARADEQPRRVTIEGRRHSVMRLLSESTEQSVESRDLASRYTVLTEEFLIIELVRTNGGIWYLVSMSD